MILAASVEFLNDSAGCLWVGRVVELLFAGLEGQLRCDVSVELRLTSYVDDVLG